MNDCPIHTLQTYPGHATRLGSLELMDLLKIDYNREHLYKENALIHPFISIHLAEGSESTYGNPIYLML